MNKEGFIIPAAVIIAVLVGAAAYLNANRRQSPEGSPGAKAEISWESGDTHTLIFTLTPEEFAKTSTGDPVTMQYGRDNLPGEERWDFGPLDKGLLDRKR